MSKFNPFLGQKVVASVVDNMIATATTNYDAKSKVVAFDLSVGIGKSSTKIEITNEDAYDVSDKLRNFDPDRTYTKAEIIERTIEKVIPMRPVADPIVKDSPEIERKDGVIVEKDGKPVLTGREEPDPDNAPYVQFKVSTAKNTRYVVVPVSEWPRFVETIDQLADNADAVYNQAVEQHAKIEAAAKAKADKAPDSNIK